ncbi:DsbA family protein [Endozoicomonas sp. OPT23]|uniref:DsbA family protein n=1 Tax=Endozoicomonas sp. OPT23 TaxID=2072845 RepID=UPI001891EB22|nr:DsbA family protein [Endozoicomonas sp. OPT23]
MKKALFLAGSMLLASSSLSAATLDDQQQQQVKDLVRETLIKNPEILIEAMTEYRKREAMAQQHAESKTLEDRNALLFNDPDSPFIGNPDAKLTITLFSDYNCGYCKRQDPVLQQLVKENPDVKVVIKELPILGPESLEAANYAMAVFQQDKKKYIAVNNRLISKPGRHSSSSIKAALKAEGVDVDNLKIDDKVQKKIQENIQLAQELGIRGTPALVFSDQVLKGYTQMPALKEMIAKRLK